MKAQTISLITPIHQHQNIQFSKNQTPNEPIFEHPHNRTEKTHNNIEQIGHTFRSRYEFGKFTLNRLSMVISHSHFAIGRARAATHALRAAQKLVRAHFSVVLLFLDNFSTNLPAFFMHNIKVDFLVAVLAVFSCKWASTVSLDVDFFMFETRNCRTRVACLK